MTNRTEFLATIEGTLIDIASTTESPDTAQRLIRLVADIARHRAPSIDDNARPARSAETVRFDLRFQSCDDGGAIDKDLRTSMIVALVTLTHNDDAKRHAITAYLFDKPSTKDLTAGEARVIVEWCECRKVGDRYVVSQTAADEARAILRAASSLRRAA